jgi:hypothetical protein
MRIGGLATLANMASLFLAGWGAQFYVEAGVAEKAAVTVGGVPIPPNRLKYYRGWPRRRFGDLPTIVKPSRF